MGWIVYVRVNLLIDTLNPDTTFLFMRDTLGRGIVQTFPSLLHEWDSTLNWRSHFFALGEKLLLDAVIDLLLLSKN